MVRLSRLGAAAAEAGAFAVLSCILPSCRAPVASGADICLVCYGPGKRPVKLLKRRRKALLPWLAPLLGFMALLLAASLHALTAAGHFPRAHDAAPRSAAGALILYGSMVLSLACVAAGLVVAWHRIP